MKSMWKRPGLMSVVTILVAIACVPVGAEVSEWADLGATNASSARGLVCFDAGDGQNTAVEVGGVDCRANDAGSNYMYFGVDDAWAYQGSKKSVCVAVEYFDNVSNAQITLQYDSVNGGSVKDGIPIYLMGTNTWKTFLWHIEDAYFGNRQSLGADFRIKSAGTCYINMVYVSADNKVEIDMGTTDVANGLVRSDYAPDGDAIAAVQGGVDCRKSDPGSGYFYFGVDDGWASAGSRRDLYITAEYYDNGSGPVILQYDSTQDGAYRQAGFFYRRNTNAWKTRAWYVKDAYFGNRQNAGSDFRIYGSGAFYLDKVRVWEGHKATIDLGATNTGKGIVSRSAGDGVTTAATAGGLDCRQTAAGSRYFYMQVDDAFAHKGTRPDLYITAHYYDEGSNWLMLQYDSTSDAYKQEPRVYRTDAKIWKSHTWRVTDAYLGNRQNGGADFRIASPDGPLVLDMVYVRDFQHRLRQKGMGPPTRVNPANPVVSAEPFKDLMTNAALCPKTWDTVGSMHTVPKITGYLSDIELQTYVSDLQSWQKLFSLHSASLKPQWTTGLIGFNALKRDHDRVVGLGGTIDEMNQEEPFYSARHLMTKTLSVDAATSETAIWMSLVRERYPNVKIGSMEPYPSFSLGEFKEWITGLNNKCALLGVEGIEYFVMDPNWARFTLGPPNGAGSWNGVKEVRDYCKSVNLPFSMIYWAAGRSSSVADKAWYDAVMQQGSECLAVNLNPDQYLVHDWLPIPSAIADETEKWSFAKSVLDLTNAYCGFKPPNGSFESPDVSAYEFLTPTGWTAAGQVAVIQSGDSFWGGLASLDGAQHAGLQGACGISQAIGGLLPGSTYSIAWAEAGRPGYGPNSLRVSIDSTIIESPHPVASASWVSRETISFTASAPTMTLSFETLGATGTVFLDAVMVKIKAGAGAEPPPSPTPSPTPNPNSRAGQWMNY